MITSIRIKNLKALKDTKECQVGRVTLLTGINGRKMLYSAMRMLIWNPMQICCMLIYKILSIRQ